MRSYILPGILVLVLALTGFFMVRRWIALGDVEISLIGWFMILGGGLLALLLGGGLMALAFYSARRGHDDAHHDQAAFDRRRFPPDDEPDERGPS